MSDLNAEVARLLGNRLKETKKDNTKAPAPEVTQSAEPVVETVEEVTTDGYRHPTYSDTDTSSGINEPEMSTDEFFSRKHIFNMDGKTSFSDVWGWTPTTVPNIPVKKYARDDWHPIAAARIPNVNPQYYLNPEVIEQVMYAIYLKGTTLITGSTGTGKTSVLEQVAAHLNMPFFRISGHGRMEHSELLGSTEVTESENGVAITKAVETDVTLAFKHGGLLCLDEVFRIPPETLMCMQSALEYPHRLTLQDVHNAEESVLEAGDNFCLFLTDNTKGVGDETGHFIANQQDLSTRNRIRSSITIEYPDTEVEITLLQQSFPLIPKETLNEMVTVANQIRTAFETEKVLTTVSLREMLSWCEDLVYCRDLKASFNRVILDKAADQDIEVLNDILEQITGQVVADYTEVALGE
jgi:cobaltochelatase CobS